MFSLFCLYITIQYIATMFTYSPKIETAVAICLAMKLYPWDSKYLIELVGYNFESV